MPLSLGSWLAWRKLTPHTLGTGQVPVRGPCTRGDGARGLRSLLCRSCRPPGSFPPVEGGGAEGELPVTQELSTSHTRFMRARAHARAHTHTHPAARELLTVLTGREAFSTPARRAWAQTQFSIEQRLRAGPWPEGRLVSLKLWVRCTQHIYPLNWFQIHSSSAVTLLSNCPHRLSPGLFYLLKLTDTLFPLHTHILPRAPASTFCLCG